MAAQQSIEPPFSIQKRMNKQLDLLNNHMHYVKIKQIFFA